MVRLFLRDKGDYLDLIDSSVTFIFSASDLADVVKLNSSYSWKIKAPKSPKNTMLLDGLGLVGSSSSTPYTKTYVDLTFEGISIVIGGLLSIKETSDEYGLYVQEGTIDFLKEIKEATIGGALDLSSLDHERTVANVKASWDDNLNYMYLMSAVNGQYFASVSNTTNIALDSTVPYVRAKFLMDEIFALYGWTYDIPSSIGLDDLWLSYPIDISIGASENFTTVYTGGQATTTFVTNEPYPYVLRRFNSSFDPVYVDVTDIKEIEILEYGTYEITATGETGAVRAYNAVGQILDTSYYYSAQIRVNGVVENSQLLTLYAGDIITFTVQTERNISNIGVDRYLTSNQSGQFEIKKYETSNVDFTSALIDLKIKDFIKEITSRYGLTAFTIPEDKHISFVPLSVRLNEDVVDWSRFYVRRKKETYLYQSYGQKNFLRHRYPSEGETYADGSIDVENENVDAEKDLYKSFTQAPEINNRTWKESGTEYQIPLLKFYDIETENDEDTGNLIFTYTRRNDTYFLVSSAPMTRDFYISEDENSENLIDASTDSPKLVSPEIFRTLVPIWYADFGKLGNKAKVHEIELALPLGEVATLDLQKRYYCEQEAGLYLLNSLKWVSGKTCIGSFTKINE